MSNCLRPLGLQPPPSMGFLRQDYWMGCHFLLLQGIFPTQRSSPLSPAMVSGFLTVEPQGKPVTPLLLLLLSRFSHVQLFVTPWTAACKASLSINNSQSLLKLMSIESVMPSNHLILCHPLLLPSSIFPSIRVFSNELALCIRWPKYWSFNFSISPSNEYSELIFFRVNWFDLFKGLWRVFSNTTVQKHQVFKVQPSLWSNSHIHT